MPTDNGIQAPVRKNHILLAYKVCLSRACHFVLLLSSQTARAQAICPFIKQDLFSRKAESCVLSKGLFEKLIAVRTSNVLTYSPPVPIRGAITRIVASRGVIQSIEVCRAKPFRLHTDVRRKGIPLAIFKNLPSCHLKSYNADFKVVSQKEDIPFLKQKGGLVTLQSYGLAFKVSRPIRASSQGRLLVTPI